MKVFLAGGTGAVGRRLVPMLVAAGYEVSATTRSADKARLLYELGATPYEVDGLDREQILRAMRLAEPEIVVHQMTALTGATNLRKFDAVFAQTNRLRTEGTDHLLAAARSVGARRVVAQSFGNWNYERTGAPVKTESDPLDATPPRSMRETLSAIVHLESAVLGSEGLEGLALRYGNLYGPGTSTAEDGDLVAMARKRRLPLIGSGAGVWSFIHVDDAAEATLAAIEQGAPGIYNIADDEPAPASTWVPALTDAVGAPSPRHVPTWLGRLAAGEALVSMFTATRGASNAKAKRELDWKPRYSSWRDGFHEGLADAPAERPR
jgi:nucleoside-diphosphate-sugar epimerase